MPLYELIVIGRCSDAKNSANLFRQLAKFIIQEGGNVREMKVLGDRILSKQVPGKDNRRHLVGRYLQVLYDGSVRTKELVEKQASESNETLRLKTFKIKDFFNDAQMFKKAYKQESPIIDPEVRNRKFAQELFKMITEK